MRCLPVLAVALLVSLFAAGCGGSSSSSGSSESSTAAKPAPAASASSAPAPSDPREAIQAWFTAARLGNAADKCALESDEYRTQQYGGTDEAACRSDEANAQPQPVWAPHTKIVRVQTAGDRAMATVQPNASTPDEATVDLVKADGGWRIAALR